MTRNEILIRFPRATESFIRRNLSTPSPNDPAPVVARLPAQKPKPNKRETVLHPRKAYEGSCRRPTVIITRCSPGHLDRDNLYAAAKKIIDCLFADGRIPGDSPADIELFVFQKTVSRKNRGTLIEILPIP